MELASLPLHEARAHLLARAAAPDHWLLRRSTSLPVPRPLRTSLADSVPLAQKLHQAGDVRKAGRHVQALAMFKAALTEIMEHPGVSMSLVGDAHAGLAVTCQEMGLWEQARRSYMAAIDSYQTAGTHENADALVTLYNNIAMTCRELADSEEAELAYVTAIELHELHLPHDHVDSLVALYGNLAFLYHDMGLSSEGYEVQRFSVNVLERTLADDKIGIIQGLRRAGVFAASAGRNEEAIECYSAARQRLASLGEPNARLLCDLWVSEAVSRHSLGQIPDALRLYQLAMDHLGSKAGRDDIMLATLQNNVGCILLEQKELEAASNMLFKSQQLLRNHPAADVGVRAEVMHNMSLIYEQLGNEAACTAYRDASLNLLEFVSKDVRQKLEDASHDNTALPAGAAQMIKRPDAYVSLPVSIISHRQRVAQTMVIPLTTETLEWAQ
jgi:tetratricopeptide (TPR) repeat protein